MSSTVEAKETQLSESINEISSLKQKNVTLTNSLEQANVKIAENDKNLDAQMEKLAQDLYLQYAAKHEQKVSILKKGYEKKWQSKYKKLIQENEELKKELALSKEKLVHETSEKKQLVKLWEEYVSLENNEKSPRKANKSFSL
ncbi:unnamed protein product [Ambrosiozyma monospora]|uniref:Unnamed protein product n=1 Tax=Ambrosiozyma monospora TaxID=43982 RepID=A0ACB5T9S7_AMBMO|nr:unnamed protein product [Ambrosiozyma monospora]